MKAEDLKNRTRAFALRVVKVGNSLPKGRVGEIFARQMIRSGTSIAANYRAACLARSRPEFISKIGIVQEEADETIFWIEMAVDAELVGKKLVEELIMEGKEILAIIIASRKTAKAKKESTKTNRKKEIKAIIVN